jgi:hypothetical protein
MSNVRVCAMCGREVLNAPGSPSVGWWTTDPIKHHEVCTAPGRDCLAAAHRAGKL